MIAHDEVWGVALWRCREFFASQKDVETLNENRFRYGDCVIELIPLPDRRMGSLVFPNTRLTFSDGACTEKIYRRFYLRFLSAGG